MSYHNTYSEASIDKLFTEPAKAPSGLGWDKPRDTLKYRFWQQAYRKRTNHEAARRYYYSPKGKAAARRAWTKRQAKRVQQAALNINSV